MDIRNILFLFAVSALYQQYLAFISLRKICRSKHNDFRDRNDQSWHAPGWYFDIWPQLFWKLPWRLTLTWWFLCSVDHYLSFKYKFDGSKPRTSRYRTCKTYILTLLVESYGFFTNQLILSTLSKNVHYSKEGVCLSDILTYTYQFSKKYLEN